MLFYNTADHRSEWVKIMISTRQHSSLEAPPENPFYCLLQFLENHRPSLHVRSQECFVIVISLTIAINVSLLLRSYVIRLGPSGECRINSPLERDLTLIVFAKSLSPYKVKVSRDYKVDIFQGPFSYHDSRRIAPQPAVISCRGLQHLLMFLLILATYL